MRYMRREKRTWALAPDEERDMRESFDKQSWVKKIDDRVELGELLECMQTLTEFYTQRAQETKVRLGITDEEVNMDTK